LYSRVGREKIVTQRKIGINHFDVMLPEELDGVPDHMIMRFSI
jgi:hypothetical protein